MRTNSHIEPSHKKQPGPYARAIRDTRRSAKRVTQERRKARAVKFVTQITLD